MRARIACHALDGALAHKAHAAMKLKARVHDLVDEFAAKGLDHRNFLRGVDPLRVEPGGVIDELPAGRDLAREHGEALTDCLLVPKRSTESFPGPDIIERELDRGLRFAHRDRADHGSLVLEIPHDRVEAASLLAEA